MKQCLGTRQFMKLFRSRFGGLRLHRRIDCRNHLTSAVTGESQHAVDLEHCDSLDQGDEHSYACDSNATSTQTLINGTCPDPPRSTPASDPSA